MEVRELETEVIEVIQRTQNVKSVRLKVEHKGKFKAGQWFFITLDKDRQIKRHLTISNSPTEEGFIEFTKKLTDSDFSDALKNIKPGDWAKIKYPYGKFTFEGEYEKITFLSGGIGITPAKSIIKFIIDKNLKTDVVLLYGNRTQKDIAFREEFDKMKRQHPKFKIVHVLSEEKEGWPGPPATARHERASRTGYIDGQLIKEEIPDYTMRKFYISGPPKMAEAMQKILTDELNLDKENIFTENFTGY
jgi:glycine betaine catabolism B